MSSPVSTALDLFKEYPADKYNLLIPTPTFFQQLGPMQRLSVEVFKVNPTPNGPDVYEIEKGKYPLKGRCLSAISLTAGISFHPVLTRIEEHRDSYCRAKAVGVMKKGDGTLITLPGTYYIDLEKDKRNGMSPARLKKREQYIVQLCESGAMNRVIRRILAIQNHYTEEELKKPFIVPRVDFAPDFSDPVVKQFLLEQATQSTAQVYGPPAGQEVAALTNGDPVGEPVGEDPDDLDDALGSAEPSENEHKVSVFKTMDKAEQTKTFGETVTNKNYPIGTKTKPSDLRKLWLMDRVAAYSELLEWQGGE